MKLERQTKKLLIIEAIVALVVIVAVAIGVSVYYKTQEKPPYNTKIVVIDDQTGKEVPYSLDIYKTYQYDGSVHTFTPILKRVRGKQEQLDFPIINIIMRQHNHQNLRVYEIKEPGDYVISYSFNLYDTYKDYQYSAFSLRVHINE